MPKEIIYTSAYPREGNVGGKCLMDCGPLTGVTTVIRYSGEGYGITIKDVPAGRCESDDPDCGGVWVGKGPYRYVVALQEQSITKHGTQEELAKFREWKRLGIPGETSEGNDQLVVIVEEAIINTLPPEVKTSRRRYVGSGHK